MSTEVFFADEQVVVAIELPELAVDDVEVFVGEVVCDLVNVVLILKPTNRLTSRHQSLAHSHCVLSLSNLCTRFMID